MTITSNAPPRAVSKLSYLLLLIVAPPNRKADLGRRRIQPTAERTSAEVTNAKPLRASWEEVRSRNNRLNTVHEGESKSTARSRSNTSQEESLVRVKPSWTRNSELIGLDLSLKCCKGVELGMRFNSDLAEILQRYRTGCFAAATSQ